MHASFSRVPKCLQFLLLSVFREKFWRVGNKERDGEYGACFFPQNKGLLVGQPPLLFCARPGSRIWEASFNGEVLSTHQFKQLLACPPLPLVTYRFLFIHSFSVLVKGLFYHLFCLFLSFPAGMNHITIQCRGVHNQLPFLNFFIWGKFIICLTVCFLYQYICKNTKTHTADELVPD